MEQKEYRVFSQVLFFRITNQYQITKKRLPTPKVPSLEPSKPTLSISRLPQSPSNLKKQHTPPPPTSPSSPSPLSTPPPHPTPPHHQTLFSFSSLPPPLPHPPKCSQPNTPDSKPPASPPRPSNTTSLPRFLPLPFSSSYLPPHHQLQTRHPSSSSLHPPHPAPTAHNADKPSTRDGKTSPRAPLSRPRS